MAEVSNSLRAEAINLGEEQLQLLTTTPSAPYSALLGSESRWVTEVNGGTGRQKGQKKSGCVMEYHECERQENWMVTKCCERA